VTTRLRELGAELRELEERLREGGGAAKIAKQHEQGKLTARERVERLCDRGTPFLEVGLLVAYDQYDGQAPAAGVVTGIGVVHGREVVVVANDATVKAGVVVARDDHQDPARAGDRDARARPDHLPRGLGGVNLPVPGRGLPGPVRAARIFYYNSLMRRYLRVPQLAAVMGQCVAGGAYLPALSDVILMVKGSSFMGSAAPTSSRAPPGRRSTARRSAGA
jgi:acetyl-CoA carboxylase carboxyltransferase component